MTNKKANTEKKRKRTTDTQDKKEYFKMCNRKVTSIRLNAEERTLLQSMMRDDDWDNTSGYIKYKLFGIDTERKINELIKRKDIAELAILLRNEIMDLTEYFIYFRYRYDKDMNQLWKEEGVDLKAWTAATNHWHHEVAQRTQEVLNICRKIASELQLEEYFDMPSATMTININEATKEELDALAEQLRKERIAMGRIEEV